MSAPPAPPAPKIRPVHGHRERVGLLVVHTGNGKGKTTAALGMAMRAAGHGMRVHVVQFVKGSRATGEQASLARFPEIVLERAGEGFTWEVRSDERQRELAAHGMALARRAIEAGPPDLLVLDEINIVLDKGFFPTDELVAFAVSRPSEMHLIATGRRAPAELIDVADLVTEFSLVKHPWERGIRAQQGIEF